MLVFIAQDPKQTQKLAALLAKEIARLKPARIDLNGAFVIALVGDLGSGKTTFMQGFVKGFGIKEKITSPTFVLAHRHRVRIKNDNLRFKNKKTKDGNYNNLYHFDCYRFEKATEILALDFKEIIKNPRNIVLIEWADKIKKLLPKNTLKIKFEWVGKDKRRLIIQ